MAGALDQPNEIAGHLHAARRVPSSNAALLDQVAQRLGAEALIDTQPADVVGRILVLMSGLRPVDTDSIQILSSLSRIFRTFRIPSEPIGRTVAA